MSLDRFLDRLPAAIRATDLVARTLHAYDATNRPLLPAAVVRPRTTDELGEVVRLAVAERVPIVPRGAGSGFSGGSLSEGGVVLDLLGLDRIVDIDTRERLAIVEPGVVTRTLQSAVEREGWFYAPDPASHKFSTLGGNVAENAGGPRCLKYGVTGDWVLAIDAFTGTGATLRAGKPLLKNRAGYDLKRLLVGSEGTLAVFSRLTLRLRPLPQDRFLCLALFRDLDAATAAVGPMLAADIQPAALEFMDHSAIQAVVTHAGIDLPAATRALLLIEVDGRADELPARQARLAEVLAATVIELRTATAPEDQERLWEIRRKASPAMHHFGNTKANEDIVVPVGRIPDMVRALGEIGTRHAVPIISFGHIGDGNIHVNIMYDGHDNAQVGRVELALAEVFAVVNRLDGAISGEHGVGLSKRAWLPANVDTASYALMREIKQVFDPHGILNPGKMLVPER